VSGSVIESLVTQPHEHGTREKGVVVEVKEGVDQCSGRRAAVQGIVVVMMMVLVPPRQWATAMVVDVVS